MNSKTIAIVSYITIIGWLIAFFQYKDNKTPLAKYHLEQSLGVFIFSILWSVVMQIVFSLIPAMAMLGSLLSLVPLVLVIIGIINAANEELKPVPVVGPYFVGKFNL